MKDLRLFLQYENFRSHSQADGGCRVVISGLDSIRFEINMPGYLSYGTGDDSLAFYALGYH